MLLPKMLVDLEAPLLASDPSLVRTKIIYFLHIPFSTSQIFRSLQYGGELLNGIIRSDVVGFHAFDHARHFLNACKRNLGLKFQTRAGGLLGVEFEGRTVSVVMRHVSIETQKIDRKMSECGGAGECAKLQAKHAGKKIVVGLDTCQRLSGVALKLLGFEKVLDEFEKWRGKLVLVQRCFRPRSRVDDEARTSAELRLLVQQINAKHPGAVDYEEVDGSRLTSGKRFGLWMAADVLLNTSVREGINLHWFEYVYVKATPGVIVASEFASTVAVLNGAMRINPFDIAGWKATLDEALCMKEKDRRARRERDWAYVTTRPSALWTEQVIDDMFQADKAAAADADEVIFSEEGEGKGPGANVVTGPSFSRLAPARVAHVYRAAARRVVVLDYGGTLQQSERLGKYIKDDINPCHKGRDLPPKTFAALKRLSDDPGNAVYVCSSLAYDALLQTFRGLPKIGLAAQNGLCYTLGLDEAPPGGDGLEGGGGSSGALAAAATLAVPSAAAAAAPARKNSLGTLVAAEGSKALGSRGSHSPGVGGDGGGTFSTNGGTRTWSVGGSPLSLLRLDSPSLSRGWASPPFSRLDQHQPHHRTRSLDVRST
jgi:trehalose 6-phosphate synthase/phosphatase